LEKKTPIYLKIRITTFKMTKLHGSIQVYMFVCTIAGLFWCHGMSHGVYAARTTTQWHA